MTKVAIAAGAVHLPRWLADDEQRRMAAMCLELGRRSNGFYTPIVRGMHPMSVKMLCLGRHWNATTYRYEDRRSDVDGEAAPPLPAELAAVARQLGVDAGFQFSPDLCIVNWYQAGSRMGLHQDKDESPASLARGAPVVSISIGDTARFLFGGRRRRDPVGTLWLESGDGFVFGGEARLRYHGVSRILPGSGPKTVGFAGRLNLTFREF
jgi:alkylated DNA repair protein (DNA oxidative demethylase)